MKTADLILYGVGGYVAYKYLWPQVKPMLAGGTSSTSTPPPAPTPPTSYQPPTPAAPAPPPPVSAISLDQARQIAITAVNLVAQNQSAAANATIVSVSPTASGWHFVVSFANTRAYVDVNTNGSYVVVDTYGNRVLLG